MVKPEDVTKDLEISRLTVPKDIDGPELAKFYYVRGQAAGRLGNVSQQISDLENAVKYSTDSDRSEKAVYLRKLSKAEGLSNNRSKALEYH